MPYGMYVSASGAEAQSRHLDVLANNLANVDTVGFKQDFAIVQARHSEAIEQGLDYQGSRSINDIGGGVSMKETVTDFSRGIVRETGISTDLAIDDRDGSTFFVVDQDGQRLLTRAGDFQFSSTGQLQTQDGFPVLSNEDEPITIDPTQPWRLHQDGSIQQGDARIPLALERPRSLGDLAKVGQNLFSPLAETIPLEPNERSVRSGYLELSSVRPTQMMTELIKATRAYEANVRMIQNQDHVIGTLVNRILR